MPKVILVLLLPAHSWVYPLTFFLFAKLRNPCPFIPIPTSGKKELTYYCAPYITTTHSHKKLKYWPTLGPDRVLGVPTRPLVRCFDKEGLLKLPLQTSNRLLYILHSLQCD